MSTLAAAAVVLPPIVYDISGKNVYFGIAHHSPLIIHCPILPDDYVKNDEKIIRDLLNNQRRANQNAA